MSLNIENYGERANRLATKTTQPTLTDQSAANDTDLNVIVKQFLKTGTAPGNPGQPMFEDFTQYPEDLRGFIECAQSIKDHYGRLPEKLQVMDMNQLLSLTPEQLTDILKPDAPKPQNQGGPSKNPPVE